jgi:hypothetical protein
VSDLLVLDGCTFFYTDATGDIDARGEGLLLRGTPPVTARRDRFALRQ